MNGAGKILDVPAEINRSSANASWAFHVDQTQNWAYWNDAFSPQECARIIEIGERKLLNKAAIGDNSRVEQVRNSKVSWLYAIDDMEWAFRRVTDIVMSLNERFFKFNLFGMTEGFQFTRYEAPDGFYRMHADKCLGANIRKLSVTIQLSAPEEYEGGELALQFDSNPEVMPKERGKLVCFPSYVLHEVRPVTKGTRLSLVAWITGEAFK